MPTLIENMAGWAAELKFDDIPRQVVEKVKLQAMCVFASVFAGKEASASNKLLKVVNDWNVPGKCTLITTREKVFHHHALFANASLALAHDFDDYMFMGHTGHSAILTSLAVAENLGKSGKDFLTAAVVANEIEGRIGASVVIGPQNGQAWSFIHLIGSAAASAKLMGLDAEKTAHAMAVSFYQPNFALYPGFMGPDSKLLTASIPSMGGLISAELAAEGFTGKLDIIENRQGFLSHFTYAPLKSMLTGFGKSWVTDSLSYKIYPGCAYIDTTIDATLDILKQFEEDEGRSIQSEDVGDITVRASMLTTEMNNLAKEHIKAGELNPININFSIPANVAIVILTGALTVDGLSDGFLDKNRDPILELCSKVKLKHDWSMSMDVQRSVGKVMDFRKISGEVGIMKLISARRRAAAQLGSGLDIRFSDIGEIRRASGVKTSQIAGSAARGIGKAVNNFFEPASRKKQKRSHGAKGLEDMDFSRFRFPFAAEVTLKTKSGREYSARQDIPLGGAGRPFDETAGLMKAKLTNEAQRVMSKKEAGKLVKKIDTLEKVANTNSLFGKVPVNA